MSFPTTLWGQLTDVYATVPGPTSTSPGSSDGPVLGNAAILADGTFVQFLKFLAATTKNQACRFSGSPASAGVTPTTAANQHVAAINDLSLTDLTINYCAWATIRGICRPLVAANVAAASFVVSSVTAGTLIAATPGTDQQGNISNTVVVGGANALSPCYLQ